tara:strand:- start:344 stop:496 length:153 start_codon:yes stop_codon:yes gene_type:complete
MKLEKALDAFSDDKPKEEQEPRRRHLMVNQITGTQAFNDARYVRAVPTDP